MIRYNLKCSSDHGFESWFQSGEACDGLIAAGRVACPVCGTAEVAKSLMAPAVRPARKVTATAQERPLATPGNQVEEALAALRREIEANSDYVGMNFAAEARRIHDGDAPERSIYGEAKPEDARALIEDGVRVAPLPFMPPRKVN
ncbi:MAG: DUF1178 domain-containing protein [Cereibacter sphaeroides]|uniref:DUF1178 domain-containing protein n=1 Tax=Cereibacter sphaeroides TaxID=1063 RepID=A0A2W5U1Q6_CERSP|nr:MAG: DUF1178 domain-containing protein [Cereibacter sphaeroides]